MEAGTLIGDRYTLDSQIGRGGMAAVWLAEDRTLRRMVAIKFLWSKDERGRMELAKGFLREARLAASIHHPNVVQVLDFGLHDDERPYMVMEALDGESLGEQFNAGQLYTLEQVAHVGGGALEGLIAVHTAGIVHRDLKPENIFLVAHHQRLQPKLIDFGISRVVEPQTGLRSAVPTLDGSIVGTPEYMAPEQARGLRDVDHRADIYAMGVILYEMVAGDVPYKDEAFGDLLLKVVAGGAPPLQQVAPSVPRPFSEVVARAMHPDRTQRFQSAAAMYEALQAAAQPLRTGAPVTLDLPRRLQRRLPSATVADTDEEQELRALDRSQRFQLQSPEPPHAMTPLPAAPTATAVPSPGGPASQSLPPRRALWLVGLAGVLVAGALWSLWPARGPSEPRYIVVQAAGDPPAATPGDAADVPADRRPEVAVDDDAPQAASDTVVAGPAAASADGAGAPAAGTPQPAPPRAGSRAAPPKRVAGASTTAAVTDPTRARTKRLSAAFRRQLGEVEACFRQHAVVAGTALSVRVSVGPEGRVSTAQVLPSELAATPAGRCVGGAVEAMRFGAQPDAVSFRVPLTVTQR